MSIPGSLLYGNDYQVCFNHIWISILSTNSKHIEPETKCPPFSRPHFQLHFCEWKCMIKISLKFVPKDPINNIPALVQVIAWHRPGSKPLPEPMMFHLLMHKCVTRPQWLNVGRESLIQFNMVMIYNFSPNLRLNFKRLFGIKLQTLQKTHSYVIH